MSEPYATASGGRVYRTRRDYLMGRFQSVGTNARVRSRINQKMGGHIV